MLFIGVAAAFAGCGGGTGSRGISPIPVPSGTSGGITPTSVSFKITFPAASASSSARRRPNYISPSIKSLTIAINGGTPIVINAPVLTGTPQTVTETVPANPGNDTFAIEEYDRAAGAGNELGKVSMMGTVVAGQDNTFDITVNGELAKIAIEAVASPFLEGTLAAGYTLVGYQPETFMAVPEDADGNTIVAPGLIPGITVASATQASMEVAQTANGNAFTLQAPIPTAFIAITATGTNLEGGTVTTSFNADSLAALYVADYLDQKMRVFDENGTPLVLPSTAFTNLINPMGIAFNPAGNGSLIVTETSDYEAPIIVSYDLSGNPIAFPSSAFAGIDQPLFASYGAGNYYVPNFYNSTISVFTTSGASVSEPTGAFPAATPCASPAVCEPVASLYDPHNNEVYVTNEGNDTINAYSATGTFIASAATGSAPEGIAFDPNNDDLYVGFAGTLGGALNAPSVAAPTPGGIDEFTEALATVTNTGGFVNASTESYFTGMAVDPYDKIVYAADAGMSKIDAFSETGATDTLATGAFSTISSSNAPASEPQAIQFVP
jgi:DNA-binding beta-propeller fold protein YncE